MVLKVIYIRLFRDNIGSRLKYISKFYIYEFDIYLIILKMNKEHVNDFQSYLNKVM